MLGRRRYYYIFSSILVLASILFIVFRGFHFGIDFAGGTQLQFQLPAGQSIESIQNRRRLACSRRRTGHAADAIQQVGTGRSSQVEISSVSLTDTQVAAAKAALTKAYHLTASDVSDSQVSNTLGFGDHLAGRSWR